MWRQLYLPTIESQADSTCSYLTG